MQTNSLQIPLSFLLLIAQPTGIQTLLSDALIVKLLEANATASRQWLDVLTLMGNNVQCALAMAQQLHAAHKVDMTPLRHSLITLGVESTANCIQPIVLRRVNIDETLPLIEHYFGEIKKHSVNLIDFTLLLSGRIDVDQPPGDAPPIYTAVIDYFKRMFTSKSATQFGANCDAMDMMTTSQWNAADAPTTLLHSLLVGFTGGPGTVPPILSLYRNTLCNVHAALVEHIYPMLVDWLQRHDTPLVRAFVNAEMSMFW